MVPDNRLGGVLKAKEELRVVEWNTSASALNASEPSLDILRGGGVMGGGKLVVDGTRRRGGMPGEGRGDDMCRGLGEGGAMMPCEVSRLLGRGRKRGR